MTNFWISLGLQILSFEIFLMFTSLNFVPLMDEERTRSNIAIKPHWELKTLSETSDKWEVSGKIIV